MSKRFMQAYETVKKNYKFHELANNFPLMDLAGMESLADDIFANGQRQVILRKGNVIMDGRNRLIACCMVGVKPRFVETKAEGSALASLIWSLNGERRHLTPSQRATAAVVFLPDLEAEAKKAQSKAGSDHGKGQAKKTSTKGTGETTVKKAAKITGANPEYVRKAQRLKNERPRDFKKVQEGETTINAASQKLVKKVAKKPSPKNGVNEKTFLDFYRSLGSSMIKSIDQSLEAMQSTSWPNNPMGFNLLVVQARKIVEAMQSWNPMMGPHKKCALCRGSGCKTCNEGNVGMSCEVLKIK